MPGEWSIGIYDADQYRIQVAGVAISKGAGQSGYADGEFFKSSQPKDSFIIVEGTDGSIARSKTNTRILEMSLFLLQTSSSNAYLSALHASDLNNPNGAGIGSFIVEDLQGTTKILCTRAWIRKPADMSLDRQAGPREWMFHGIYSIYLVGGN